MRARAAFALVSLALVTACGLPSKEQRVQEAAYELNMGLRFSRSDIALTRVMRTERARFTERHKKWHGDIKIVDIELAGVAFRDDGDAVLFMQVSWQRADEQDMRMTVVSQRWHDKQGSWLLHSEERAQGSFGLFGDVAPLTPSGAPVSPEGAPAASARADSLGRFFAASTAANWLALSVLPPARAFAAAAEIVSARTR